MSEPPPPAPRDPPASPPPPPASSPPAQSPPPEAPEHRLDPDLAARAAAARAAGASVEEPPPAVNPRRYGWTIGIFGLVLVIVISIYQFARNGVGTAGVPPGKQLHKFVAPLASSGAERDANTHPRCDPAHPNTQGLNVCGRTPLVLGFFVTGSPACTRAVDALQTVSRQFASAPIQFAAVAVRADRVDAAATARRHRWTIPVAYDRDGAIGDLYGVEICPLVEVAQRGGIVARRLIGERWSDPGELATQVHALLAR